MIGLFLPSTTTGAKHRQALWFGHRKRRPPLYFPTLICDSLCAKRLGYQTAVAGFGAFEFERDVVNLQFNDADIKELDERTPF